MRPIILTLALGLFVAACSLLPGGSSGLTGKVWQWSAMTEKVPASQSVVSDPQNYTIEFKSDGTYALKADCNSGSGSYTTSGSSLTINAGPMTLVACGPDSQADIYLQRIFLTSSYAITSGQLVLTQSDEGTMTFD
jgi:heat shock protein HslJ